MWKSSSIAVNTNDSVIVSVDPASDRWRIRISRSNKSTTFIIDHDSLEAVVALFLSGSEQFNLPLKRLKKVSNNDAV